MTKSISLILYLLIISLLLCSCNNPSYEELPSQNETSANSSFFPIDIPQINKFNQQVIYTRYGIFGNEFGKSQVMLVCDHSDEKNLTVNTYLVVLEKNNQALTFEFGQIEKVAITRDISDMVILKDIDGDSIDEIIVNFYGTGNGASIAYVLRLRDNSIELLFDLNYERSLLAETGSFVPTFNCEFLENRKLRIYNDSIGFSEKIDISYYAKDFFDEKGVGKSDAKWVNCEYVDLCGVNTNNKNEIFTECFIKLGTGFVGRIKMTYSYDSDEDTLLLTNAEMIKST